jgi:hypothetical protein
MHSCIAKKKPGNVCCRAAIITDYCGLLALYIIDITYHEGKSRYSFLSINQNQ